MKKKPILIIVLVLLGFYMFMSSNDEGTEQTPEQKSFDYSNKENYLAGFDYEEVSRYPDKYKGNRYVISGEVIQVESYNWSDTVVMRVSMDGDINNNLYVVFDKDILEANVLVDDEVTLYAEYKGLKTYTTVLGSSLTVPEVEAYIIDIKTKENVSDITENNEGNTLELTEKDIEVVNEYIYSSSFRKYRFLVVKNNSNVAVEISTSSLAYDENDMLVAVADASVRAVGTGCTSFVIESYDTDSEIAYYKTEWTIKQQQNYESVLQDLTYKENAIEGGVIIQVTNEGTEAAKYVEGYTLFFKDGQVVDMDWNYFTDNDSEIKAGKTISKQINTNKEFDSFEFHMSGWRRK